MFFVSNCTGKWSINAVILTSFMVAFTKEDDLFWQLIQYPSVHFASLKVLYIVYDKQAIENTYILVVQNVQKHLNCFENIKYQHPHYWMI